MQIYFIRHAQSINNALWDKTGSSRGRSHDPQITETGWKQARLLANLLVGPPPPAGGADENGGDAPGFGITHLYCSLMERAVITGSVVAQALGLPLQGWVDLHEWGGLYLDDEVTGEKYGMPGHSRSYFQQNYPELELPPEATEQGWWNRPYESDEERLPRAKRILAALLERHEGSDDRIALVSHGGFFNYFMTALLGMPGLCGVWFLMNNTGVTRIDIRDDEQALVYQNYTAHLPAELIT
jgi:2,3-bisphosphoglycerate-dependent phosphoglycerate mutase